MSGDGAVVAEADVAGQGEHFGGRVLDHARVGSVIERALIYALRVWQQIDRRDQIDQVFLALAVPGASQKVYAMVEPGNRLAMGGMFSGMPDPLVVPEPPLLVRRADLDRQETINRLRAELKRRFAAANMVHEG